ncbi:DUF805 domain-containing protein [Lactobacillus sp. LL6]|uniref:DUF805 domain-containing protein n=1 Tax=Lactobacillus sp. LL6 TaxID=2596827 RepID=UPI001184C909|nr:DUF805 domain-containing protein [Lactobacillus sp. LL6]TSO25620.1 DUF805 domain-containing protein [Lactobacillus sp. LL6]
MKNKEYYFIKPYNDDLPKPPEESFSEILNEAYLHPFTWKARTTRKSYWISILVNLIISILAGIIIYYGNTTNNLGLRLIDYVVAAVLLIWIWLAGLGQLVRRLHDVGYSGYWYWANLIPYGSLFLFYLSLQPSKQAPTEWGTYLYSDVDVYGIFSQNEETTFKVPVPTIGQILKEHFFDCFKWNARSTRTSYWVGTAISSVITAVLVIPIYFFAFMYGLASAVSDNEFDSLMPFFLIAVVIMVAGLIWTFLAQLGHTVRRLHDAGMSGWWFWITIIPYIGNWLLAFLLFHPTVEHEVKWEGYLFKKKDTIR